MMKAQLPCFVSRFGAKGQNDVKQNAQAWLICLA